MVGEPGLGGPAPHPRTNPPTGGIQQRQAALAVAIVHVAATFSFERVAASEANSTRTL